MSDEQTEFKVGGFCRLKAEAAARMDSTPARLLREGWPNWFAIDQIYHDEKKGILLRLDPCCGWMEKLDDRTSLACQAHPAENFELIPGHLKDQLDENDEETEDAGEGPSGGRYAGFALGEGVEDVISVEYVNGGKAPAFIFRKSGKAPQILKGSLAIKALRTFTKLGIL